MAGLSKVVPIEKWHLKKDDLFIKDIWCKLSGYLISVKLKVYHKRHAYVCVYGVCVYGVRACDNNIKKAKNNSW